MHMREKISNFVKRYVLWLGILILGALFVGNFFLLPDASSSLGKDSRISEERGRNIPKLSEIKGPRINDEAASIALEDDGLCAVTSFGARSCSTLPVEVWVFLLSGYLFLIIFNLGVTFGKRETVQWAWEAAYTVLALGTWFAWDGCRENLWFPLYVMALGVPIYLFYLYFFWERRKQLLQGIEEFRKNQKSLF